jgi:hypothetical protein
LTITEDMWKEKPVLAPAGRAHRASRFLLDRRLGEYAEFFTRLSASAATAEPR